MKKIFWLLFFSILLNGCAQTNKEKFKTHSLSEGNALRINVETGQISLVTNSGVPQLPDDRYIKLVIGKIYYLEDGASAVYKGNMEFSTADEDIMEVIFDKYKE